VLDTDTKRRIGKAGHWIIKMRQAVGVAVAWSEQVIFGGSFSDCCRPQVA